MKLSASKRPASILGLSVTRGQLRVAHAARAKNAVATLRAVTAPLTLDLLHPEPELVGREIRNHLEAAGLRERLCVVALPPDWLMSQQTPVPELSAEDLSSLLQIEAEKGFPCDPEELQISRSSLQSGTSRYITQLAVRKEQLNRLADVLKEAGLKPVSFSLGVTALPGALPAAGDGGMTIVLEPKGANLLIAAGGGIAAFRTLEATIDSEAGENVINGPALAREVRISYEQVPSDLRRDVRFLALRGEAAMVAALASVLAPWAHESGLTIDTTPPTAPSAAEEMVGQLAERFLRGVSDGLEFLPPRPSRWSRLMARYNSKRLATAGFAAGVLLILTLLAFGWQEFRRWSLRSEWEGMTAQVTELDGIQSRIREYRPWYDTSLRNLTILRRVVECFPDNGSVTAKSFEIHGPANVSITGTARDNPSLLRTLDLLRQAKEIQGLKIEQIRGKTPAQFTFTFRWVGASNP